MIANGDKDGQDAGPSAMMVSHTRVGEREIEQPRCCYGDLIMFLLEASLGDPEARTTSSLRSGGARHYGIHRSEIPVFGEVLASFAQVEFRYTALEVTIRHSLQSSVSE